MEGSLQNGADAAVFSGEEGLLGIIAAADVVESQAYGQSTDEI